MCVGGGVHVSVCVSVCVSESVGVCVCVHRYFIVWLSVMVEC